MRGHKYNVIDSDWNQIALESDYPGDIFCLLDENKNFSVFWYRQSGRRTKVAYESLWINANISFVSFEEWNKYGRIVLISTERAY